MRRLIPLILLVPVLIGAQTYRRVLAAERVQRNGAPPLSADAIVVFGGECYPDQPCLEVRDRLDHAQFLYEQGLAGRVLLSGGEHGGIDEVEVMGDYLVRRGVPASALEPARPGDNTRLTIASLAPAHSYIAVSSAYHAHRITTEARRHGLQMVANCAPASAEIRNPRALRVKRSAEVLACVLYAMPEQMAVPLRRIVGRLRYLIPERLVK